MDLLIDLDIKSEPKPTSSQEPDLIDLMMAPS